MPIIPSDNVTNIKALKKPSLVNLAAEITHAYLNSDDGDTIAANVGALLNRYGIIVPDFPKGPEADEEDEDDEDTDEDVEYEPTDDDLVTKDYRRFYRVGFSGRGPVITVPEPPDFDAPDWIPLVKAYQDKQRFWGTVWLERERGGYDALSLETGGIVGDGR